MLTCLFFRFRGEIPFEKQLDVRVVQCKKTRLYFYSDPSKSEKICEFSIEVPPPGRSPPVSIKVLIRGEGGREGGREGGHTHKHEQTQTNTHTHAQTHAHTLSHAHAHKHAQTHANTRTHARTHARTNNHAYSHVRTRTYYTHSRARVYIQAEKSAAHARTCMLSHTDRQAIGVKNRTFQASHAHERYTAHLFRASSRYN